MALRRPSSTIIVGATVQLEAITKDASGITLADRAVTWTSSNNGVATVSSNGLVTGIAAGGPVTITATSEGQSGTAAITVSPVPLAPVASVTVSPPSSTINVGAAVQLAATTKDANGNVLTGRAVTWTSSNNGVASVSSNGLVTGVASGGPVTITAASDGQSGTAAITVSPVPLAPVASVTVSPPSSTINVGATVQFTATTKDANGNVLADRAITWTSNNNGIATVSSNGLVTGVASGGPVTITAASEGQTGTATITVSVVPLAPVASVTVSPPSSTINVGATVQLAATTKDANGNVLTGRAITWTSSNNGVATVSSNGLVTGVAAGGPVTITATSEGQNGTSSVTVTLVPVASVTVSPPSSTINVGATVQLTATTKDANGNALTGRAVTWTSSNSGVASVSSNGLVTGVASGGPVTITAASEGQSGTASVTVTPVPVASVTVSPPSSTIDVGATVQLTATTKDANGNVLTGRAVTWTSSNSGVATVSSSGLVTGVAAGGPVSITATSEGQIGQSDVTVSAAFNVTDFATGSSHTCGLSNGKAYCWGWNVNGQLGDGTTTDRLTPTPVAGGLTFSMLAAAGIHTCGLTTSGAAYCWGANDYGVLGDGTTTSRSTPTPVSGGLTFTSLSAGEEDVCGLTTGGAAYCWGNNDYGQVGDGTIFNTRPTPTHVTGGVTFARIEAGGSHTCGLTTTGAALCWGKSSEGEIGDGNTSTNGGQPTPTPVAGGLTYTAMTAGFGHNCAVATSGSTYCWGLNFHGQLGNGSSMNQFTPVQVDGGLAFVSVAAGFNHTCGLTSSGQAYCWGDNESGKLGDGSQTGRFTPTAVVGGLRFVRLAAGGGHTCGVTTAGEAYCWGENFAGQVGDGSTTTRLVPTPVLNP